MDIAFRLLGVAVGFRRFGNKLTGGEYLSTGGCSPGDFDFQFISKRAISRSSSPISGHGRIELELQQCPFAEEFFKQTPRF